MKLVELKKMKLPQLKAELQRLNIAFKPNTRKDDLVLLLQKHADVAAPQPTVIDTSPDANVAAPQPTVIDTSPDADFDYSRTYWNDFNELKVVNHDMWSDAVGNWNYGHQRSAGQNLSNVDELEIDRKHYFAGREHTNHFLDYLANTFSKKKAISFEEWKETLLIDNEKNEPKHRYFNRWLTNQVPTKAHNDVSWKLKIQFWSPSTQKVVSRSSSFPIGKTNPPNVEVITNDSKMAPPENSADGVLALGLTEHPALGVHLHNAYQAWDVDNKNTWNVYGWFLHYNIHIWNPLRLLGPGLTNPEREHPATMYNPTHFAKGTRVDWQLISQLVLLNNK